MVVVEKTPTTPAPGDTERCSSGMFGRASPSTRCPGSRRGGDHALTV